MTNDADDAFRPLPVVLNPVADELLSSWLARHAAYYGVTGPFFAKWLMLGTCNLSVLDHRLGLWQVAHLSEKLRCDPIALIAMTFIDTPTGSAELICRSRPPQICWPCADRYAREDASGAVPKHWRNALAKGLARDLPRLRRALVGHERASRQRRNIMRYQPFRPPMAGSYRRGDAH